MKKTFSTLLSGAALLGSMTMSYGQGFVQFQNSTATSPILFGPGAPGAGTGVYGAGPKYTYGLYIAPAGTQLGGSQATLLNGFKLMDTTGSAPIVQAAGALSGGPVVGQGNVGAANSFTGLLASTAYAFVVAGWTTADGSSYAAALANAGNDANLLIGTSTLGSIVTGNSDGSTGPAPQLFGSTAGLIGGFNLSPVPEPSTIVLGGLGAAALMAFRRRK